MSLFKAARSIFAKARASLRLFFQRLKEKLKPVWPILRDWAKKQFIRALSQLVLSNTMTLSRRIAQVVVLGIVFVTLDYLCNM